MGRGVNPKSQIRNPKEKRNPNLKIEKLGLEFGISLFRFLSDFGFRISDFFMICPHCAFDNFPGSEQCDNCQADLTQLDRPIAQDRVERSLMEDPLSQLTP